MIYNLTQRKVLSTQERRGTSYWSQIRGLMFRPSHDFLMIFSREKRVCFHTWFVFFPLDILTLDSQQTIREIKREMKPFTFWKPQHPAKYVVELAPTGRIVHVGDQLKIKYKGDGLLAFFPKSSHIS